jgi:extradiol dioxygenase family protein
VRAPHRVAIRATASRSQTVATSAKSAKALEMATTFRFAISALLSMEQWEAAAEKLRGAGTKFVIEPHIRFKGEVGEQATMFFLDPSGNALEFKAFANMASLFAK